MSAWKRVLTSFSCLIVLSVSAFATTVEQDANAMIGIIEATIEIGRQAPILPDKPPRSSAGIDEPPESHGLAVDTGVTDDAGTQPDVEVQRALEAIAQLQRDQFKLNGDVDEANKAIELLRQENERLRAEIDKPEREPAPVFGDPLPIGPAAVKPPLSLPKMGMVVHAAGPPVSEHLPAQLVIKHWGKQSKLRCPVGDKLVKEVHEKLTPLKWTIGESDTDQIKLVETDSNVPCPQIELYQNGIKIKEWDGYQTTGVLSNETLKAWNEAPSVNAKVMGSSTAGAIHAKPQVQQLFAFFRERIGEGKKGTFVLARSGGTESFNLLSHTTAYDAHTLLGDSGRVDLAATGAIGLPIESLGFTYQIIGSGMKFDADPILIPGLADKLHPSYQGSFGDAVPVGFIGIDDVLLAYNVLSMIRDIYSLAHPSADLLLPSTISASAVLNGDKITIDFDKAPSIRLFMLFTFNLKVVQVVITEDNVHVVFSGSRWIKSRDFSIVDGPAPASAIPQVEMPLPPLPPTPIQSVKPKPKPLPVAAKQSTMTLSQMADSYRGPIKGVAGMTVQWHLVHDHGYKPGQLSGLNHRQLINLHSIAHYGYQ